MLYRLVFILAISSSVLLTGCGDNDDECAPRDVTFCIDPHHIWTCAPRADDPGGPYVTQTLNCADLTDGQAPYCGTDLQEDGSRGETSCRETLGWPFPEDATDS